MGLVFFMGILTREKVNCIRVKLVQVGSRFGCVTDICTIGYGFREPGWV